MRKNILDGAQTAQTSGRTVVVAPKQMLSIIRVSGDNDLSQMLTAVLAYEPQNNFLCLTNPTLLTAILRFGVGGQQNEAEIDIMNGAVVSVPGSYLEVLVRNDDSPGSPPATVSASVGYGTRGQNGIPTAFRTIVARLPTEQEPIPSEGLGLEIGRVIIPKWAAVGIVAFYPANAVLHMQMSDTEGSKMYEKRNLIVGESFPVLNGGARVVLYQPQKPNPNPSPPGPPTVPAGPAVVKSFVQFALVF